MGNTNFFGLFASGSNIDEIINSSRYTGGLWLGNMEAAHDIQLLKSLNIKAVLTVGKGLTCNYPTSMGISLKVVRIDDLPSEKLSKYFDECVKFIDDNRNMGRNVFVHCYAGISRSPSIVAAYLMRNRNWSSSKALEFIRQKRDCINPNQGFQSQLKKFESRNIRPAKKAISAA